MRGLQERDRLKETKNVMSGNKKTTERTSEGIKRGDVQGYSLYLGPENSVWHCVWHLADASTSGLVCGYCAVSFCFSGDSCLSFFSILVLSDRQQRSEACWTRLQLTWGVSLVQEIHWYTTPVVWCATHRLIRWNLVPLTICCIFGVPNMFLWISFKPDGI